MLDASLWLVSQTQMLGKKKIELVKNVKYRQEYAPETVLSLLVNAVYTHASFSCL